MIKLFDIFERYNLEPSKVNLIRHSNKGLAIFETYRTDRAKFEAYQSFQAPNRFAGASHVAVFAPTMGTTALFLGLWNIRYAKRNIEFTITTHSLIDQFDFPNEWHRETMWYGLNRNSIMDELSERLVIEWGKGPIYQKKDKKVMGIKFYPFLKLF
jgi:hypothetical protein